MKEAPSMNSYQKELLSRPAINQEQFKKDWLNPRTRKLDNKRTAHIVTHISTHDGHMYWHTSVRIVRKNRPGVYKPFELWMAYERLQATRVATAELDDVGNVDYEETFSSPYALHLKRLLTTEECRMLEELNPEIAAAKIKEYDEKDGNDGKEG